MNYKKLGVEAVVLTILLIGAASIAPVRSLSATNKPLNTAQTKLYTMYKPYTSEAEGPFVLDRWYNVNEEPAPISLDGTYDDAGTRKDAGNDISKATAIYPGEILDDTPGRGNTGKLQSSTDQDWYRFQVCTGQDILVTLVPPPGSNYTLELWDKDSVRRAVSDTPGDVPETISFTADYTGRWYIAILYLTGSTTEQYTFSVTLIGQNDAGTWTDAPNDFANALLIPPGTYNGYLDISDPYDWYKFQVNAGQGIRCKLEMKTSADLSDFDIQLYNPSGTLVYEEKNYYDDELLYPADVSGEWRIRLEIFPGWVDIPQPTEWQYYTYGSGPYTLTLSVQASAPAPPAPIPQPQITPIAKTYIVNNDPTSTKDDFGYLAAIPASNYLSDGKRYLAPIIYTGDTTETNYFGTDADRGTVDDTTQYVVDDWNTYLASHGKTPVQYTLPADPITAAAEIATQHWSSSDRAVVAIDGSSYEDTVKTVIQKTKTLKRNAEVIEVSTTSEDVKANAYIMFLKPKWCAINVSMYGGGGATPTLNTIIPHFMEKGEDWWPSPYDAPGDKWDIYQPVTRMGFWSAGTDQVNANWYFKITKYEGHRYRTYIRNEDCVITAKVTTETPADLLVFLVDPQGYLRAPDIPQWNGPVNPIHEWNGLENPPENPWRCWNPGPHTEFTAEVLHPNKGLWTVIVVPRNAEGSDLKYTLTVDVRTVNPKRAHATVSAANAAVIASQEHIPLLYITEDDVPAATASAFTTLGVNKVIFVERGNIGSAVKSKLPTVQTDLKTMQEIVDHIKTYDSSENYITFTSIKQTGQGFFAPAAMLAAYHGAPVLRIEDAPGNPASVANRIETYRLWGGDYYHGSRSCLHLPVASVPVEQNKLKIYLQLFKYYALGKGDAEDLPPFGLDAKRYWSEEVYNGIHGLIESLGLDLEGQEAYCFVAPRKDIYLHCHSIMMGNNSYAGHFPGITTAYTAAHVARSILYPALIFANPGRNITTSQLMNYPDGGTWKCNDKKSYSVFSSREVKRTFSSHFRKYEGHCLWEAHLERMNNGASIMYYSGHGTGGSGISAQYIQTEHCNYPDQIWWDAWRGYSYDTWKTARFNGMVWYNAEPPQLYDIIHYDYVDQLTGNLRSQAVFYMSCTTGDAHGPMVYLDHGAVVWYGNADSGLCPEADLQDDEFFKDALIYGEPIGKAYSKQVWLHFRDFTTGDPTSMYGSSSMQVSTIQVIYGDPNLIIYSPSWTSPVPVNA
ncbi:MAG: hypothetical protein QXL17_05950 [Candidatus Thermoplasmatota archaeon]